MKTYSVTFTLLFTTLLLVSQESPLGFAVEALRAKPVPVAYSHIVPRNAALRLLIPLGKGDAMLVYDLHPTSAEPDPHILIVAGGVNQDTALSAISEYGENYTVVAFSAFRLSGRRVVALAFRNVGDGSGSIFTIFMNAGQGYQPVLARRVSEGQLRLKPTHVEIWSAAIGAEECTWCPHYYDVSTFALKGTRLYELGKRHTRTKINPTRVIRTPLIRKP